jgi:hypothetical protein
MFCHDPYKMLLLMVLKGYKLFLHKFVPGARYNPETLALTMLRSFRLNFLSKDGGIPEL